MKFFFDMAVARCLARGLAGFFPDDEIVHLEDDPRFRSDNTDIFIIETLSRLVPPPVFVSADRNMKTRGTPERKALRDSGLTVVFFRKTFHQIPIEEQVAKISKAWPEIRTMSTSVRQPTVFEVGPNGKVENVCLTSAL